jgi:hypothetical protein
MIASMAVMGCAQAVMGCAPAVMGYAPAMNSYAPVGCSEPSVRSGVRSGVCEWMHSYHELNFI